MPIKYFNSNEYSLQKEKSPFRPLPAALWPHLRRPGLRTGEGTAAGSRTRRRRKRTRAPGTATRTGDPAAGEDAPGAGPHAGPQGAPSTPGRAGSLLPAPCPRRSDAKAPQTVLQPLASRRGHERRHERSGEGTVTPRRLNVRRSNERCTT